MSDLLASFENLQTDLHEAADSERALDMVRYMKDNFDFLGITSPERKAIAKPLMKAAKAADIDEVLDIADRCWEEDAREFQYVGAELLRAQSKKLRVDDIDRMLTFVARKSWWDTIDGLAGHPIGTMVWNYPELGEVMDDWISDEDMWVARVAILHQLFYKADVNEARLFSYVDQRAADTEFFIRKALGWALRSYARDAPDAVRNFVAQREDQLSGLTKREALKHLR